MSELGTDSARIGWSERALSGVVVVVSGAVLLLSALLVPSPSGHGTHLQLGLGQCTFLSLTGRPCPMCGATTTFSLMAHFRPIDAVVTQPFAAGLFLLVVVAFAISFAELVDPRARWTRLLRRLEPWEPRLATGFLVSMGASWWYKILTMGTSGVGGPFP